MTPVKMKTYKEIQAELEALLTELAQAKLFWQEAETQAKSNPFDPEKEKQVRVQALILSELVREWEVKLQRIKALRS